MKRSYPLLFSALLLGLAWSACKRIDPLPTAAELAAKQDLTITQYLTSQGIDPDTSRHEVAKTANGTYVIIDSTTAGAKALQNGMTVLARYRGRVLDSTDYFDQNLDTTENPEPFRFELGTGDVIRGWDEGILKFRVGDKGRLIIPSAAGYGSSPTTDIPANSILHFDITVVNAQ